MEWSFIGTLMYVFFLGKAIRMLRVSLIAMRMLRISLFEGNESLIGMWDATNKLLIDNHKIYFL